MSKDMPTHLQRVRVAAVVHLQTALCGLFPQSRPGQITLPEEIPLPCAGAMPTGRRLPTFRLLRGRHCVRILAVAVRVHGQLSEEILQQNVGLGIALSLGGGFQLGTARGRYGERETHGEVAQDQLWCSARNKTICGVPGVPTTHRYLTSTNESINCCKNVLLIELVKKQQESQSKNL